MLGYFRLLFIAISVCEGCRSQVSIKDTTSSLPIPYPKYMVISDPSNITVRWDPVEVSENNPILGFKIKLWEDEKQTVFKHVEKDGNLVLVEELVPITKLFDELPTHEPALVAVVPPDVFTASFFVKKGEHYELRGQSFNADGDGPLSNSYGITIGTSYT